MESKSRRTTKVRNVHRAAPVFTEMVHVKKGASLTPCKPLTVRKFAVSSSKPREMKRAW